MRRRGSAAALAFLALLAATGVLLPLAGADRFSHTEHEGLFPSCLGCHLGIPEDAEEEYYSVTTEDCAACHDGDKAELVDWDEPLRRATNVSFSHSGHANDVAAEAAADEEAGEEAGEEEGPLSCGSCHQTVSGQEFMDVAAAEPAGCIGCHAHQAPEHLETNEVCTDCHVSLSAAARLPAERISDFPEPADHEDEAFLPEHGDGLAPEDLADNCAVCHARESCTRCHLNVDQIDAASVLSADFRVAGLLADSAGEWPEPASHLQADYEFEHAAALDSLATCANCHAAESCTACHQGPRSEFLAQLPARSPGGPSGIDLAGARPPGHTPAFVTEHRAAASTSEASCSTCHFEAECADCHSRQTADIGAPSDSRGFHPGNFVLRHGAEAFTVQSTCSDCHSAEAFCRDCHDRSGLAQGGAAGAVGAYHDAQSDWLIRHGSAARLGMEACASCHQQTSCLRCHSAKFGLRVNPHGPGFDPQRVADRSLVSCASCHFSTDLEGI
ncbi:MAG: hypothetical protein ABFS14_02860 [Gemmatimonadota bacterium]